MILAVTGHRPDRLGGYRTPNRVYNSVIQGLDTWLMSLRPEMVITGMALGVDQWIAALCLDNDIPYTAAIPFESFSSRWPDESRWTYDRLVAGAARVHVVTPGDIPYSPVLMAERNRWMVDNSEELLCVVLPGAGDSGTASTIRYASNCRKTIHRVQLPQDIVDEALATERTIAARREARAAAVVSPQSMSAVQTEEAQRRFRAFRRREAAVAVPATITNDPDLERALRSPDPIAEMGRIVESKRKKKKEPEEPKEEKEPVSPFRRVIEI